MGGQLKDDKFRFTFVMSKSRKLELEEIAKANGASIGSLINLITDQWLDYYKQLTAEGMRPNLIDVMKDIERIPKPELEPGDVLWKPVQFISTKDLQEKPIILKWDPVTRCVVTRAINEEDIPSITDSKNKQD